MDTFTEKAFMILASASIGTAILAAVRIAYQILGIVIRFNITSIFHKFF